MTADVFSGEAYQYKSTKTNDCFRIKKQREYLELINNSSSEEYEYDLDEYDEEAMEEALE